MPLALAIIGLASAGISAGTAIAKAVVTKKERAALEAANAPTVAAATVSSAAAQAPPPAMDWTPYAAAAAGLGAVYLLRR